MLNLFKLTTLEKYNKQRALTQHWKKKHDTQLQAHQDTILDKDKKYKALKELYDLAIEELSKHKEK